LNLGPDFVVLHKLPTISGRQANIHRLHEADVVLQISAQDLLRQFVGFQASLGRDLGKLRFLFGLQTEGLRPLSNHRRNLRSAAESRSIAQWARYTAVSTPSTPTTGGTVLRQFGVFDEPPSVLGQIGILATHPITIARALARKLVHK
jgi:hypothetical protein